MSIIKNYREGATQLNKLKFAPAMAGKLPPLVETRIPNESNSTPPRSGDIQTRADDLSRIAKIFTRREGLQFLTNNTTLNTAIAQSYTIQGTLLDKAKALLDVNRGKALLDTVGTLGSTLAQVPLTGTGTHFIKGKLFGRPNTSFNRLSKTTANTGDPGSVRVKYDRDIYNKKSPSGRGTDRVNALGPYIGNQVKEQADDYIKFFFEILKPGESESTYIHLRAFLDSFSDDYTGNWGSYNYIGRGEQFFTYQSFNRGISVSFKSAVATKVELKPVYQKLVYLASLTAPTYSENGIMRGTFIRLNIGDYLSDTPGFITSVNYGWEPQYSFEIARGKKEESQGLLAGIGTFGNTDKDIQELPHILNCSFTFTPIHTFTPQTGLNHYITNPQQGRDQFFPVQDTAESSNTVTDSQRFAGVTKLQGALIPDDFKIGG